ncbi:MAG: glycosyltransferase family 4 protein [Bacteroidales bacterium]|nr:glycosyltransferase family 4 protein [Bacteroidales bacterium]
MKKDVKKIRFFIPSLVNSAGMERISTGLANILQRQGYNCGFVVKDSDTTSFFPLHSSIQVKSILSDGDIKKVRYKAAKRLRQYLKREKPDVLINVDVSMIQISALAFTRLYGVKLLTWEQFSAGAINTFAKKIQRYLAAFISKKLIVLTKADKQMYPLFLQNKVEIIGNFTQINPDNILSTLDNKTALSVGRMAKEKGFDLLIKAWKKVKEQNSDWHLRIIGGGKQEYVDYLQGIVDSLSLNDVVKILPPTKEIGKEYAEASLYVLPSRHEPFGLVLIEAKSFGLPTVSFDCPYGPKEIINDKIDGYLVENENTDDLAEKINNLISDKDKMQSFSLKAIEDYNKRWTEKCVEEKWLNLLKRL